MLKMVKFLVVFLACFAVTQRLSVRSDTFDPDDLFKERPETPLGLDDDLLHSDSDSMVDGRVGHNILHPKPKTVYAYDAAAEKEKERRQMEMAKKSPPVESIA